MSQIKVDQITDEAGTGAPDFPTMPSVAGAAIIERESNANGEFVKYADGTMICLRYFETSAANPIAWTFPAVFVATPTIQVTAQGSAAGNARFANYSSPSASTVNLNRWTDTGTASGVFFSAIALGRWF
jgi:hypothetical protein